MSTNFTKAEYVDFLREKGIYKYITGFVPCPMNLVHSLTGELNPEEGPKQVIQVNTMPIKEATPEYLQDFEKVYIFFRPELQDREYLTERIRLFGWSKVKSDTQIQREYEMSNPLPSRAINVESTRGYHMGLSDGYREGHADAFKQFEKVLLNKTSPIQMVMPEGTIIPPLTAKEKPQVGVGVFIVKNNQVLLGKRKGSHGEGTWAIPGGHLEYGEGVEGCAEREVKEEMGIDIDIKNTINYTNNVFSKEKKHYITLYVYAETTGTPMIMEPDKCTEIGWFDWNHLPEPLFSPLQNYVHKFSDPQRYM